MENHSGTEHIFTKDEQRQYDALVVAIHGGIERDTLPNNSPKFSIEYELAKRNDAANSIVLEKFWSS